MSRLVEASLESKTSNSNSLEALKAEYDKVSEEISVANKRRQFEEADRLQKRANELLAKMRNITGS